MCVRVRVGIRMCSDSGCRWAVVLMLLRSKYKSCIRVRMCVSVCVLCCVRVCCVYVCSYPGECGAQIKMKRNRSINIVEVKEKTPWRSKR
jgi:hypothetical protein